MENELLKITPDKAVEILRKDGIDISIEEAQIVLDFLYIMANIVVDQYMNIGQCDTDIIEQTGSKEQL